jgi:TetR/AcrR family transcriptional repressor of mexJK operon
VRLKVAAPEIRMIDQIIEGAERAFLAAGYETTTMDAIARQAGVARASVYNNFATKDALFLAVMRRGIRQFVERAVAGDDPAREPWERLRNVATNFLTEAIKPDSIEIYRVVIAQGPRFPDLSKTLANDGLGQIEAKFSELANLSIRRIPDPATFASHLIALLMGGPFSSQMLGITAQPNSAELRSLVDQAIDALAGPTTGTEVQTHASSRA